MGGGHSTPPRSGSLWSVGGFQPVWLVHVKQPLTPMRLTRPRDSVCRVRAARRCPSPRPRGCNGRRRACQRQPRNTDDRDQKLSRPSLVLACPRLVPGTSNRDTPVPRTQVWDLTINLLIVKNHASDRKRGLCRGSPSKKRV
jgi:hypothetical protein